MYVQGYILCVSTVTEIEEVREKIQEGNLHDVKLTLQNDKENQVFFTAPKWIMNEDIVFFYHEKTSLKKIKSLRRKIKKSCSHDKDFMDMIMYVNECEELYNKYGGRIYAVGKINGKPHSEKEISLRRWQSKTRIFAPVSDVTELQHSIKIEDFEELYPQGWRQKVIPVLGNAFVDLKKMIEKDNDVPCLKGKTATYIPLKDASKGNWLTAANACDRRYMIEEQFRKYYADYFLSCISDDGKIYTECSCFKDGKKIGIADYFILVKGKYVPVEAKISFMEEWDIIGQIEKYCNCDSIKLSRDLEITNKEKISQDKCYVIDTEYFLWYSYDENRKEEVLYEIAKLKDIKSMADIRRIKSKL